MNFNIYMSDETKLAIDQQASKENRSRSNMIEVACKEYLEKRINDGILKIAAFYNYPVTEITPAKLP
jgi:predicted transcriptional regulator